MKEYKTELQYSDAQQTGLLQKNLNRRASEGWELLQYVNNERDLPFIILVRDKDDTNESK